MIRSFATAVRVSLARTRADWPIVAAAWFITLLAAVLFSAGMIYPSAAAEAGLRRALADAPAGSTNVDMLSYVPSAKAREVDGKADPVLQSVLGSFGGAVVRDWRGNATLALRGLPGSVDGDQAEIGFLEGIQDHATLAAGEWPSGEAARGPTEPIPVVVQDVVATSLGLRVGDELGFVAHASVNPVPTPARLVGTYSVSAASDPFWDGDAQLLTGVRDNGQYRTLGPFLGTREDLLSRPGMESLRMQWRIFPAFDRLRVDDVPGLRGRVSVLEEALTAATAADFAGTTSLGAILADAERSLLVSRTSVLLVMAQLALLAAYAIVLTATLLVDHRRVDTSMLRSRGAGAGQVALLALLEGLLLAIPAVLLAPWLAVAALEVFNVAGPLADVGLRIDPRVSTDAYIGAAAAGVVCVALLVLPAALSARRFAAAQSDLSRQETRTFGQRMGLDIALLAVTGIALWQLRLYGAPLTKSVQGSIGLDPLLVAAPAIGLIAGAVLALRVLPLLAEIAEAGVARGRSLVTSLGSRQLARRPLRYTRSALLLMLAMSMGVFALSYSSTWATSQRDQAAYQAGASVRLLRSSAAAELPGWAIPAALAGLPGVAAAVPVERIAKGLAFPVGGSVDVLAIDSASAADVVLARGDEAARPLPDLLRPLADGRPAPNLAQLPGGSAFLRFVPTIDIRSMVKFTFDPETGEETSEPIDPATVEGLRVGVRATVRDARGQLHQVTSPIVPFDRDGTEIVVPLLPVVPGVSTVPAGAHLEGPLSLASLGMEAWLPDFTLTANATFGIAELGAAAGEAGPWTDVPLAGADVDTWATKGSGGRGRLETVGDEEPRDALWDVGGAGGDSTVFGGGTQLPGLVLAFVPTTLGSSIDAIPMLANRAFLESVGAVEGDTLSARLGETSGEYTIAGVVESFPTTDPSKPLVIVDQPTLGFLRLQSSSPTRAPDEWWLRPTGDDPERLAGEVRAAPINAVNVVSVTERTRSLSTDPVALGIIGALTLGFVATSLFALVGLIVSTAVGARQRRTEFALLRALGLSGRQLAGSLWLENGSLVVVSLVAGTALGLVIGWLVLPFVTVTQRASAPVPPVIVEIPWDRIALLDVASAVALGVAVVVIGGILRRIGVGSVLRMGED